MAFCKICVIAICAGAVGFGSALMLGAGPDKAKPMDHKDMPAMSPEKAKQMEMWQKNATPGEMHKKLAYFVGNWTTNTQSTHSGNTETATGTCSFESMFDGRFVVSHFNSTYMNKPYSGMGIWGYNNAAKQFESLWCDNMSTGQMFLPGSIDPTGKIYTFAGEFVCPMDSTTKKTRFTITIVNDNSFKMDFFGPGDMNKEEHFMTIEYTRVK